MSSQGLWVFEVWNYYNIQIKQELSFEDKFILLKPIMI